MGLQFEINLRRMAMIATAQALWDQPHAKNKLQEIICNDEEHNGFISQQHREELLNEIMKGLPSLESDLRKELAYVLQELCYKIEKWYLFMKISCNIIAENFGDCERFSDKSRDDIIFGLKKGDFENYCFSKIYWTDLGHVDKVKTFSSVWLDIPDMDVFYKFLIACYLCEEPLIDMLWDKLPKDVQNADYSNSFKDRNTTILAYWISKKSTYHSDMDFIRNVDYDANKSVEEIILNHMGRNFNGSHHLVLKYFFKKLGKEEAQKLIPSLLDSSTGKLYATLFLYNKMSEDTKRGLFEDDFTFYSFLRELLSAYPWPELFIPAVIQLRPYLNESDYVLTACEALVYHYEMGSADFYTSPEDRPTTFNTLILQFWNLLEKSGKELAVKEILPVLFQYWDIKTLKMIFNDPDLEEQRKNLLRIGYEEFMEMVWGNERERINHFVGLLISENWEEEVKSKLQNAYQVFTDVELAAREEEKINHEILVYYFLGKHRVDLIPKWANSDILKENIKNNDFTLALIYEIWLPTKSPKHDYPENLCNQFLLWLFNLNPDDALDFRKNVILKGLVKLKKDFEYSHDEPPEPKLSDLLKNTDHFEMVHDLLSWCSCTEKQIRKIKSNFLISGIVEKFRQYMKSNKLDRSKKLLNWAFTSEKNRNKFKRKFITSDAGIKALKILIGTMKSEETDPDLRQQDLSKKFKDYIEFWMESLEAMIIVQNGLKEDRDYKKNVNRKKEDATTKSDNLDDEWSTKDFHKHFDHYQRLDCEDGDVILDENNFELFMGLLDCYIKEKLHSVKTEKLSLS